MELNEGIEGPDWNQGNPCGPLWTFVDLCGPLCTFMYICVPLLTFLYLFVHLYSFLYLCVTLCTFVPLLYLFVQSNFVQKAWCPKLKRSCKFEWNQMKKKNPNKYQIIVCLLRIWNLSDVLEDLLHFPLYNSLYFLFNIGLSFYSSSSHFRFENAFFSLY